MLTATIVPTGDSLTEGRTSHPPIIKFLNKIMLPNQAHPTPHQPHHEFKNVLLHKLQNTPCPPSPLNLKQRTQNTYPQISTQKYHGNQK